MTRGEALNNPGNIEHGPQVWEGQSPDQPDPKLVKFATAADGLGAIVKTLRTYQRKGITTIAGAITRWAPPTENDTVAYIADECAHCSASPGSPFMRMLLPFIRGLISHEQGRCIYSDAQIQAAIDMAKGVPVTPNAPVTVHPAAAVVGAGGVAFAITSLVVGAFYDFGHVNITADRQAAMVVVITAALHYFFTKGDAAQS